MREARSHVASWAIVGLLAVLIYAAWEVMVAPITTGSAYPDYSSLRSDPLGSKAAFASLDRLPELAVRRGFKNATPPNRETTLLLLGLQPQDTVTWPTSTLEKYEHLLTKGGRVVLAFTPTTEATTPPPGNTKSSSAPGIQQRWNLTPQFAANIDSDTRESSLTFVAGPEWSVLQSNQRGALVAERPLVGGTLVVIANGFVFSNQSLAEGTDTELLSRVLGASRNIVFDEEHLGVVESGSVAVLGRKYNLEPAAFALLIAAILFVWSSSSPFLPLRPRTAADVLEGQDSHTGLAALLRRSVPTAKLMDICVAEWERTARSRPKARLTTALSGPATDVVETYRRAARALKEKHD